ncbi:hypothetical protein TWF217_007658 [Orbilia oligospora]|nr:hypothetical protein TWF128_008774 [Orbilia oligospora]KAF3252453.1 hypothetical protein TWF217_007658 [Orbilia oligospora]KAF3278110.1 hypothetical protein TWF132_001228 [Orbilia oligospora]
MPRPVTSGVAVNDLSNKIFPCASFPVKEMAQGTGWSHFVGSVLWQHINLIDFKDIRPLVDVIVPVKPPLEGFTPLNMANALLVPRRVPKENPDGLKALIPPQIRPA